MVVPYLYNVEVWAQGFFKPLGRRGEKEYKTGEEN